MDTHGLDYDPDVASHDHAADRFHDALLGRLIQLRYGRLTAAAWLILPLLPEYPLLAAGQPERERAALSLQRDLKFALPALLPGLVWLHFAKEDLSQLPFPPAWPVQPAMAAETATQTTADGPCGCGVASPPPPPTLDLSLVATLVVLLVSAGVAGWIMLLLAEWRSRLALALPGSDIAQRLAFMDERVWDILDYTPRIFHLPFMSVQRNSPLGVFDLVSSNLDWYLAPPRLLVRLNWLAELLLPFALLEATLFIPANGGWADSLLSPLWLGLAVLVWLSGCVALYAVRRRELFQEALITLLRGEFER